MLMFGFTKYNGTELPCGSVLNVQAATFGKEQIDSSNNNATSKETKHEIKNDDVDLGKNDDDDDDDLDDFFASLT